MDIRIFNASLAVGWLLVLAGGVMTSPGPGLAVAGLLLIGLSFASARMVGAFRTAGPKRPPDDRPRPIVTNTFGLEDDHER